MDRAAGGTARVHRGHRERPGGARRGPLASCSGQEVRHYARRCCPSPGAPGPGARARRAGPRLSSLSAAPVDRPVRATGVTVATVLYPGSFDPIHNGHLEIIETAASLFDHVVVAAVRNPQKSQALFSLDERRAMLEESVAHLDNVEVTMFSSLVVDLAREMGCDFIVRGLRVLSDFENEMQMAQMNQKVSGIHTLFLPSASGSSYLGSQLIRELARFGADVSAMVPEPVAKRIEEKYP